MINNKTTIRLIGFFILFSSCQPKFDIEFSKDFTIYIRSLNDTVINKGIYILLPVFSCSSCQEEITNYLENNDCSDVVVICIADTYKEFYNVKKRLKKYKLLYDIAGNYSKILNIEGNYPYFVEVEHKKVIEHYYAKAGNNMKKALEKLNHNNFSKD